MVKWLKCHKRTNRQVHPALEHERSSLLQPEIWINLWKLSKDYQKQLFHIPKQINSQKVKIEAKSKIGSLNNISHKPGGGNVKIKSQRLSLTPKSKIGSLENAKHTPGGGNVKVHSQRLRWEFKCKLMIYWEIKVKSLYPD